MPTPNAERNSDIEISSAPLNVDTNDGISDLIMINSTDTNVDTFTSLPIEFETSNSSMETVESVESIPMLTDIAEETIYETEFFDENVKSDAPKCDNSTQKSGHINDVSLDISSVLDAEDTIEEISESKTSDSSLESSTAAPSNDDLTYDDSNSNADEHIYVTLSSDNGTETSNTISLADMKMETKIVPNLIENITIDNSGDSNVNIVEVLPSTSKNNLITTSNVFNVNSIGTVKTAIKPTVVSNTSKFVPISIAPNSIKRPASISIGQPSTNLLTKVVVSQSKAGQPIMITNSPQKPRPVCVLQSPCSNQSPVKSITFAQAKQMGLIAPGKLQPIRPSTTKPGKPKFILSNIPTVTQGLKKIQPITKSSTPTKILPAPLVSNSTTVSQPQKIFIRQVSHRMPSDGNIFKRLSAQDYVMKSGTLIPKQQAGQVITISNLQTPVISNHVSPKKQVQYIKLLNNVGSTNMPTVTTTKGKVTTLTPTVTKIDKDTPIIVASSNFNAANLNVKNATAVQTSTSAGSITVVPMITTSVKTTPGQRLLLPAVSKNKEVSTPALLTDTKQLKPAGNIVVLPEDVLEKIKGDLLQTPIKLKEEVKSESAKQTQDGQESVQEIRTVTRSPTKILPPSSIETGNGLRSRKPCNCTRSQCLKLYCECFANGEFCNNCNCVSCHNNISHEENRQHAIRSCLDRNPQAFRPKIGKCLVGLNDRRHTKGCHCKRSGCLKNYCECYEAQIPCSENCKCVGCKNVDDMLFATTFSNTFEKSEAIEFQNFSKSKLAAEISDAVGQSGTSASPRHAFSFVKDQVVEATCQCLLAQAEEVKRRNINIEDGQKYILEEFGRCLIQIIECAKKSYDNLSDKYVSS